MLWHPNRVSFTALAVINIPYVRFSYYDNFFFVKDGHSRLPSLF